MRLRGLPRSCCPCARRLEHQPRYRLALLVAGPRALAALQKDSGYLFESGETPPPYAAGTGSTALHGADADTAMRQAMGLPIDN